MKAAPVTVKQLADWVEKNKSRTWNWPSIGKGKELTLEMKYIYFSLDTRDMEIWYIRTEGGGHPIEVSDKDEFDGTILDLLEKRLDER